MAERILDIEDRLYERKVHELFRNFTNETDVSIVRAWTDLYNFCLYGKWPKAPLAIVNHCTAQQLLLVEESVLSTHPIIKQYATEIVDTIDAACRKVYGRDLDAYLERAEPEPLETRAKLAEVIDISRFRRPPFGPQTM